MALPMPLSFNEPFKKLNNSYYSRLCGWQNHNFDFVPDAYQPGGLDEDSEQVELLGSNVSASETNPHPMGGLAIRPLADCSQGLLLVPSLGCGQFRGSPD